MTAGLLDGAMRPWRWPLGRTGALLALAVASVSVAAPGQAPTPYCGRDINLNPAQFTYIGTCPSQLPPGFGALTDDAQHDMLEARAYAPKSPPRRRRCATGTACTAWSPTFWVEARIQAVSGIRFFHPQAMPPGALVVLARIHHTKSFRNTDKDSLTGSRNVVEDYYILAKQDPNDANKTRTIFLGYSQDAKSGEWTRFVAADEGQASKCEQTHTPLKVDMADFAPCGEVHDVLSKLPEDANRNQIWAALTAEGARRYDLAMTAWRRSEWETLKSLGYYPNAVSPFDDHPWAPCALGCCVIWRN